MQPPHSALTDLPEIFYQSDRDASNRLVSTALRLELTLGSRTKAALEGKLLARRTMKLFTLLSSSISVEVVRIDGQPLECFIASPGKPASQGQIHTLPPPHIGLSFDLDASGKLPQRVVIAVLGGLPVSSAHGNAPFRLAVKVCEETLLSTPVFVYAKRRHVGAMPKARRPVFIVKPSAERLARLRAIRDACVKMARASSAAPQSEGAFGAPAASKKPRTEAAAGLGAGPVAPPSQGSAEFELWYSMYK